MLENRDRPSGEILEGDTVDVDLQVLVDGGEEVANGIIEALRVDVGDLIAPEGPRIAVIGQATKRTPRDEAETWLWAVDARTGEGQKLVRLRRSNHYLAHQGANLCWSSGVARACMPRSNKPPSSASERLSVRGTSTP